MGTAGVSFLPLLHKQFILDSKWLIISCGFWSPENHTFIVRRKIVRKPEKAAAAGRQTRTLSWRVRMGDRTEWEWGGPHMGPSLPSHPSFHFHFSTEQTLLRKLRVSRWLQGLWLSPSLGHLVYAHIYVHACICTHVHMHTHMCVHPPTHACMHMHKYTRIYVHTCICTQPHIYMYTCTHTISRHTPTEWKA